MTARAAASPAIDVARLGSVEALVADAGGALDRHPIPYARAEWLRLQARHVASCAAIDAVRARDGADAAWLLLDRAGEAWASWYALRAGPIFVGEPRADLLAAAILERARGHSRMVLAPVAAEAVPLIRDAFRDAGWWSRAGEATANWVAHVGGMDFAAYWAARPSRLRNTVRRRAKGAALDLSIHDRFDAAAWDAYETIYAASWKGAEGSPAFLRAMAEWAGAEGRLRLGIAHKDGVPAAAQLWTVDGDVATIHKLAYDEAFKALSPGSILGHAMFAHVIDSDRPATIDYGTGDQPYKAEWMDERRALMRIEAWNPRSIGGLARAARARLRG